MTMFIEFDDVDEFSASAVGEPGSRVFYINARSAGRRVTVRCEKQQVKAIATYLRHVLSDLPPPEHRPMIAGASAPSEAAFILGPIGLGYDRSSDRLVVQLEEIAVLDEEGDAIAGHDGHVRLYVTRGQAAAFCEHADRVIAAGRPDCRWCSLPIDPDGHACPRMN